LGSGPRTPRETRGHDPDRVSGRSTWGGGKRDRVMFPDAALDQALDPTDLWHADHCDKSTRAMAEHSLQLIGGVSEPLFRLASFAAIFVAMAVLELASPKRAPNWPRGRRWLTNLAVVGVGILVLRVFAFLAVPLVAVGAAMIAELNGWGLFNQLAWPSVLEIGFALVVLDFAIWLQHLAFHKVPILWRVHQMHHADVDFDVTTALRFHPIETGLSMLYKVVWVLALGASPVAVLLFEVILNGCAMFNHANVDLPPWLDRILRQVLVTPDMHRVHHSIERREHDTNFGFNLSFWDRLFGTYTPEPAKGHLGMTIGLKPYQSDAPTRLGWSLALPFRGQSRAE
jgi:sterol desaturase/sphingolipid hydroxylase (fatty acid hydroxylase superfamily)